MIDLGEVLNLHINVFERVEDIDIKSDFIMTNIFSYTPQWEITLMVNILHSSIKFKDAIILKGIFGD